MAAEIMTDLCFLAPIGDEEAVAQLEQLEQEIEGILIDKKRSYRSTTCMGQLLGMHGVDLSDIYCRGFIEWVADEGLEEYGNNYTLWVVETDKGKPVFEAWDTLLKLPCFNRLTYVAMAEDPYSGLFINTDTSGEYYTARYRLICQPRLPEFDRVDMFFGKDDLQEIRKTARMLFGFDVKSFEDMQEKLAIWNEGKPAEEMAHLYRYAESWKEAV